MWIRLRELLSMAREEFIKSCKLMDQMRATVTAIILIWSRRTIFIFNEKKKCAILKACLWIISSSLISWELMKKHQQANLTCTELPGYPKEIWENLAMRGHLQSVQKGTVHLEIYYVNFEWYCSNYQLIILHILTIF